MEYGSLVSVIVPVYNVRPYLSEALDSALCQTYKNIEIIVIDDGSTDGSGEICDEYAARDSRIRLIRQKNRGLSCARNAGLDVMRGEAVAFLDSDDAYRDTFIARMVSAMIREGADAAVCAASCQYTEGPLDPGRGGKPARRLAAGAYGRQALLRALTEGALKVQVWNKVYRRAVWEDVRFREGHVYEDLESVCRVLSRVGRACVVDEALYMHRKRPGSITTTPAWSSFYDWEYGRTVTEEYIRTAAPEPAASEMLGRFRASRLNGMILWYCRLLRAEPADRRAEKALRKKIVSEGKAIGRGRCRPGKKVLWQAIRICPGLVRIALPLLRRARRLRNRTGGRRK